MFRGDATTKIMLLANRASRQFFVCIPFVTFWDTLVANNAEIEFSFTCLSQIYIALYLLYPQVPKVRYRTPHSRLCHPWLFCV